MRLGRGAPPAGEPALAELYDELAPAVLGYLRAQRVADAEDRCGDVFVNVARGLPRFKGDADACRRWVFTIAHNVLVDAHRRAGRTREQSVESVPDRGVDDRHESVDAELLAALAELTPEQREVIALRFVADLDLAAVAKVTGMGLSAVKMAQQRGLERLRHLLGNASIDEV